MPEPIKDTITEIYEEDFTPEMLERAEKIKDLTLDYDLELHKKEEDFNPAVANKIWLELADQCYGDERNGEVVSSALRQLILGNAAKIGREALQRMKNGFELQKRVADLKKDLDWVMSHTITLGELAPTETKDWADYDPKEQISACLGKKSERPYVLLDEEFKIYGNLNVCTLLLAEKTMDYVDPPCLVGLDGEPYPDKLPMPWRKLRLHPWAGSTPMSVSIKKLTAFVQDATEKTLPKKFIPNGSKADVDLPYVILDFGETFGCMAFRFCELRMFIETAHYLKAETVLFGDACSQLVAVQNEDDLEKEGSFVAVMPSLLYDGFPQERMFVIEM